MGSHTILGIHTIPRASRTSRSIWCCPPPQALPPIFHCCVSIAKTMFSFMLLNESHLHQHKQGSGLFDKTVLFAGVLWHFIRASSSFRCEENKLTCRNNRLWTKEKYSCHPCSSPCRMEKPRSPWLPDGEPAFSHLPPSPLQAEAWRPLRAQPVFTGRAGLWTPTEMCGIWGWLVHPWASPRRHKCFSKLFRAAGWGRQGWKGRRSALLRCPPFSNLLYAHCR